LKQRKNLGLRQLVMALVVIVMAAGLAGLQVSAAHANGTNYYVDSVNGSDSNSGTSSAAPWKTLANINSRSFNPGDTISLKDGSTWSGTGANSAALTIDGGGAAGNPIVVQSYGSGNAPILTNPTAIPTSGSNSANGMNIAADYVTVNGIELDNNAEACVDVFGTYVTIENSQMTACGAGVEDRANYTTITHNNFHDLIAATNDNAGDYWGGDGMMIEGSSNDEIDYNTCTNCISTGFTPATGDGGFVEFYDSNSNVTIDHNYVNNTWQVSQLGSSGGTDSNIEWAYNVFINVGPVIGLHLGGTWETNYSNLVLINNTCYWTTSANGPNIIYTDSGDSDGFTPGDFTERNNLFVTTASGMGTDQNTEAFTHDHNIYEGFSYEDYSMGTDEYWNENPDFVNAGADNFELQAGSPAIGAGLAPAPFSTDYAGDPVPSANGVDIGAYEYEPQASPTATPTTAPTATPTTAPTATPTMAPTATRTPTVAPTAMPTTAPSATPTTAPTATPTTAPTATPTTAPTATRTPTTAPTATPTTAPTATPTTAPTATSAPTVAPTATPTTAPTATPTTAPTATSAPTTAPGSSNMLQNGSFESATSPWLLQVNSPASASLSQDTTTHASDGGVASAKISITTDDTSNPYYIQVRQEGLSVCSSCSYQFSFWATAAGSRSIQAVVQGQNSPYTVYFDQSVTLGTSWQEFTYTVTPNASDTVFVGFNLGASTSTVWIDGVSFTSGAAPTATPTVQPTTAPTATPTTAPTATRAPTATPTTAPTATRAPTATPTTAPTATRAPTATPTTAPTATRAPTAAPTSTPAPSNMLQNGTFNTSVASWALQTTSPAAGTLAWDGTTGDPTAGSAKLNITTADSSDYYYAQFRQTGLNLVAGQQYEVTFWAKASGSRSIQAVVQGQNSPYTVLASQNFSLTTSWQQFTLAVTPSQSTTAFLGFNLAASTGTVWLDTVSLAPAAASSTAQGRMAVFLPTIVTGE
jgi:hypothetical protein